MTTSGYKGLQPTTNDYTWQQVTLKVTTVNLKCLETPAKKKIMINTLLEYKCTISI